MRNLTSAFLDLASAILDLRVVFLGAPVWDKLTKKIGGKINIWEFIFLERRMG